AATLGDSSPVLATVAPQSTTTPPAPAETRGPKTSPQNVWPKAGQNEAGGALWVILTGLGGIMGLLIWGIVIVKRLARNAALAQESKALTVRMIGGENSATAPDAWR